MSPSGRFSTYLLDLALQGVGTALGEAGFLGDLLADTGGILESALGIAEL